jgi:hypothetical protein
MIHVSFIASYDSVEAIREAFQTGRDDATSYTLEVHALDENTGEPSEYLGSI